METVYFNGLRFSRPNKNCYFRNSVTQERLHRYVWKYHYGEIPEGYDIHHIDGDKGNNDISNLQMLSKHEHQMIHSRNLSDEQREWRRNNMNTKARPKAIEWHKSDSGKTWHTELIKKQHQNGAFKHTLICTYCGNTYIGEVHTNGGNTFCSNKCKSAYRRKIKSDNISVICLNCGKSFMTNKYKMAKTCSRSCTNHYRWLVKEGLLNEGDQNKESL